MAFAWFHSCGPDATCVSGADERGARAERGERERTLIELERLAFVPPGVCIFPALSEPLIVCGNDEALLVERFEVTRADWRRWFEQEAEQDPVLKGFVATWTPESDDWPASFMTLDEARRFARSRGQRLLTAREWIRVASGTRPQLWPWGKNAASSVANTLELNLGRPVPVGTFEQGRTPTSIYDLVGNIAEWVEDPVSGYTTSLGRSTAWAMGGSFFSRPRVLSEIDASLNVWSFNREELDPAARSSGIGLRCAAPAAAYLWEQAANWGADARARDRLTAVGASWGRDAAAVLDALCQRDSAPAALRWLLEGARR